jgi:hypothetical protein
MSLLLAKSLQHAVNSAMVDWRWERINTTWFKAPDGDTAMYAPADGRALRGLPPGTKVYLGYGWYEREDAAELEFLFDQGRFVRAEPVMGTPTA